MHAHAIFVSLVFVGLLSATCSMQNLRAQTRMSRSRALEDQNLNFWVTREAPVDFFTTVFLMLS